MNNGIHMELKDAAPRDEESAWTPGQDETSVEVEHARQIAVAATFTAELIQRPLKFWMEKLAIPSEIKMAPYAQMMQELLNPSSLLSSNQHGFNILLVRLEDWVRDRMESDTTANLEHLRRASGEFIEAVRALRRRTGSHIIVFFGPPSSTLSAVMLGAIEDIQREAIARLNGLTRVHWCSHADIFRLYNAAEYEDSHADRIAHIPYTDKYFVAMATLLARKITALMRSHFKVIAIDCDNTLWRGVCGEDGAYDVEITPAHRRFQELLVQQHDAGMLLCLCTKNNPSDVEAVFRAHPGMPLREEHLVCSRVNWQSKSANLQSIAEELGLALDSFIFIDDSSLECAEVLNHCPSVLTLQIPGTQDDIEHFVDHVWAFDRIEVTEEAKQRTVQYKQNIERKKQAAEVQDLEQFLASLELKVDIAPMESWHLLRVAELIQRTNQFNLTTIRRSLGEIETLWKSGTMRVLVVHVQDRFGNYGLVGAVFLRNEATSIEVDTFVLSCRVLGRRVEHKVINELGRIARQEGWQAIVLRYQHTPRNVPAWEFLEKSFVHFRSVSKSNGQSAADTAFIVPAEYAENLSVAAGGQPSSVEPKAPTTSTSQSRPTQLAHRWHEVAYRFSRLDDVMQEIDRSLPKQQGVRKDYIAPRTPTEVAVATIWNEVLGIETIGVNDDFFQLGGDSLSAIQVIARIGSTLGAELSVYDFFEQPTVEKIAEKIANASRADSPLERVDRNRPVPLSWAQQRLWFLDQLEGGTPAYHIPVAFRLHGNLDRAALQAALDGLVRRHEALRTVFIKIDGEVVQHIASEGHFALQSHYLRTLNREARESKVVEISRQELNAPFNLSEGPLIRGNLLQLSSDEHVLLIIMHHIISDGWSLGVLMRELGVLYAAHLEGQPDPLPSLLIQYADFAYWQRHSMAEPQLREHLSYWMEHLKNGPDLLELPTDRPRPPAQSYRGGNIRVSLGSELTADLKAFARGQNVTLAMTLYTALVVLFSRLSGQEDIVVGMPISGRRRTEFEGLIGFFVNTLAVRVRLEDDPTTVGLIQRAKAAMLGAYAHQDVPFEQVVEVVKPTRNLSHSPIFQVMFAYQNTPSGVLKLPGLSLAEQEVPVHTAQFDLNLLLQEVGDEITGSLNFASDLFDAETIERWGECFEVVLRGMVENPQEKISRLPVLTEDDRRQVVEVFNATQVTYPERELIHQLFEGQVERTPEAVAVVYDRQSLTYAQLNSRANQLARHLRDRGIGPDRLVGICLERSLEMVVGLLGILKSGGAYVPLDPDYPAERLAYMLTDASPQVVLTNKAVREKLPDTSAAVIALDDWAEIGKQSSSNVDARDIGLRAEHLAYVIYTSGSTGKPKGAMNEHRAVINRLQWMRHQYLLDASDSVLQKTPFSFDVSVWEFFWTLTTGARLVMARPQGHQDPEYLTRLIDEAGVTTLHFVPSMLQVFLDHLQLGSCTSVRHIVCSGEELSTALQNRCLSALPHARLSNLYGPTEAAIDVTAWECKLGDQNSRVPIGHPISNIQMYVLDRHRQPVPIGVAGEIYIGGVGVGRGYLNRPDLTAERFIADQFSEDPHARLYKTGDLGRWRPDGAIEYLGRNDHQVKIRGFRIELGEIEAQLAQHEKVKEAVVIAREQAAGDRRLVAYMTCRDRSDPHNEELRSCLKARLPDYMVPSAFVILPHMPLSPNGKLDRRALPAPGSEAYGSREYEAPQGEVEKALAGIWQKLLGIERVGRHDNFFELGGHSLLAVKVVDHLRPLALSANVRSILEHPILTELADALMADTTAKVEVPQNLIDPEAEVITPAMLPLVVLEQEHIERIVQSIPGGVRNIQDIYPLVPLQEGILFHHVFGNEGGDTYVLPLLLSVASRQRLDELIKALQAAIDRHDALRTAILWEGLLQPVQVVCRQAALPVNELVLDPNRAVAEQVKEWMKPERQKLDIRYAPLMRLQVAADPGSSQWYALLQLHHMTIDHVTLELLTAEVVAHLRGLPQALPEAIPYRNHLAQALVYARTQGAEAFFRIKLGDVDESTAPFDLLDVHGDGSQVEEASKELEPELARRIRTQARRLGVSTATLFHAAWSLVLAHTTGRDDVVFGSVLLGRIQGDAEVQRILGMFINTLPLRLLLQDATAKTLVERTHQELMELLRHEQASLVAVQRCSGVAGSTPLFTTLFNYRHSVSTPVAQWAAADGVTLLSIQERTNYPIAISVDDLAEGFSLVAQTDRRIEPHRVVSYLHTAVQSLIEALEQEEQTPVLRLKILPESERRQIIEGFNATDASYPDAKSIHELFEEQVERTPEAVAVVYEGRSLTYAQLNAKANQLAWYLRARGVGPDKLVGLCVERSLEMLLGVLGVLKAGGAYLPMDPSYPVERLAFMLKDAKPGWLLTQAWLRHGLPETTAQIVALDGDWENIVRCSTGNLDSKASGLSSRHLAYVIYTSGSTGRPKGVMIEHRNAVLLWHGLERLYQKSAHCRSVALNASLNFDASVQQWLQLLSGRTVYLIPQQLRQDASMLLRFLSDNEIDAIDCTPSQLKAWIASGLLDRPKPHMVLVGGEAIDAELWGRLAGCTKKDFYNVYGPTECTVDVTAAHLKQNTVAPHIGRPMENRRVYILDRHGQPAPMGVAGEIYVGGSGVGRGYLNRPELTTERFVPDPFSSDPLARMYRTGDLGRWQADRTIEYVGRNDHQVKIRGYRIELGEIEAQLARHDQVKEALVITREDVPGDRRLVAYVVLRDAAVTVEILRAHLKVALPEYMVPSAFMILTGLPLTPSGKLDRQALPVPELTAYARQQYEPPQGEEEEMLAGIWQELLKLDRVGRNDNFFELGGHSLLVLEMLLKINHIFDSTLRAVDVYKSPSLRELATRIGGHAAEDGIVDLSQEAALDDEIVAYPVLHRASPEAVLLTGGTGFVGRFLLSQLIQDTGAVIYCLVRASSQQEASLRLYASLAKWNLWSDECELRIVAVPGDLRLPHFGIDESTYQHLCRSVDAIYHCATSMNHLETYAMAKPVNVHSARELLKFAQAQKPKLINYISTLSIFNSHSAGVRRRINEGSSIDYENHLSSQGYLASKWVADKIFMTAAEKGVPCNIFRVGLVWADTQQGRFDELQNEYRVLKSCLLSGCGIENYRPPMPPTPVDYVAHAIVFLANQHREKPGIFHISSSRHMDEGVFERCNEIGDTSLTLMPYYEWVCELKRLHYEGRSMPAVPLIEFAFSMDDESFYEHQRNAESTRSIHFDLAITHRELERAGIVAPVLGDDLLAACIESMFLRDAELREWASNRPRPILTGRPGAVEVSGFTESRI